ncbi:MAG: carbon storage regulator [Planctomycetaceae bacterium]
MVIEIRGDKVRLGIDAPRDVTVHREEIYQAIKRNRQNNPVQKNFDSLNDTLLTGSSAPVPSPSDTLASTSV